MATKTDPTHETGHAYVDSPPLIAPGHSSASITDQISAIVDKTRLQKYWVFGFAFSFVFAMVLLYTFTYLFNTGIGIFGNNIPVAWGFPIVVFVWWIGIGHAGTLISAILLLFNQAWRTSINRFAEAMTLFAVANAGLMPIIHLGRPWYFYWLLPYPNTMGIWPQFRSPLLWDLFAISTYASVSLVFWYLGLVPDFATMRDRAKPRLARVFYGILALGWRNSVRHWVRFDRVYLMLAAFATPLVVSVHSVISFDFAYGNVPGWHSTVFPPYFVAGALLSGFAMVLTLAIPLRQFYRLYDMVTITHLENCAKVMLASGLVVGYGYVTEAFIAWYSGSVYEETIFATRLFGATNFPQAAAVYWIMIICNVVLPQLVWIKGFRTNVLALFIMSFIVNVGMWAERYNIVVTSLNRNFLVSSWQSYAPTGWDWAMYAGTLGFFFSLLFIFVRLVPMIPAFECGTSSILCTLKTRARMTITESAGPPLHGVMAEFADSEDLARATLRAREAGYRHFDCFTPYPDEEVASAMGIHGTRMPFIALIGAILGGGGIFLLQEWIYLNNYPLNIGGRPLDSWPAFIVPSYEMTILFGSFSAVIAMFILNGLPKFYHPVFNVERFAAEATTDGFFLVLEAKDPRFNAVETRQFLTSLGPREVWDVPL